MKQENEKILNLLQKKMDGALSQEEERTLASAMAKDSSLRAQEKEFLAIGEAIRKDTEKAVETLHAPNFTLSVMQRIEEEENVKRTWFSAFFQKFKARKSILVAGVFALVFCFIGLGVFFRMEKSETIETQELICANQIIIDNIENTRSSALVFEAPIRRGKTKVIWIIEDEVAAEKAGVPN